MGNSLISKVQDSLLILKIIGDAINKFHSILNEYKDDRTSIVFTIASSQIILLVCSYKEELKIFLSLSNERSRIIKTGRIFKPFRQILYQWDDLENFRNTFIAHNFRDPDKNNVFFKVHKEVMDIPNGFPDFLLLHHCIDNINRIVFEEFDGEWNTLRPMLANLKQPEMTIRLSSEKEAIAKLLRLRNESDLIL